MTGPGSVIHRDVGAGLLALSLATGCTDPGDPAPPGPGAGAPAALEFLAGELPPGELGTPMPEAVAVRVTDAESQPVAGVAVAFAVEGGAGMLEPTTATTDANGRAETTFTPYGFVGIRELTASIDSGPSRTIVVRVPARTEDLGALPFRDVYVTDANEDGTLVGGAAGSYDMDLDAVAVRWTEAGGIELLPMPAGEGDSWALAVGDDGRVVGYTPGLAGYYDQTSGPEIPLTWDAAGTVDVLPDDGGGLSRPYDINAAGDIVGTMSGDAVLWRDDGVSRFDDGEQCDPWPSAARATNDRGQVVGQAPAADWDCQGDWPPSRAVRWWPGEPIRYLPVPVADVEHAMSRAVAVNEAGEVLVQTYRRWEREVNGSYHWSEDSGVTELTLGRAVVVFAHAINDSSWIGGAIRSGPASTTAPVPVVWRGPTGEPVVLQELDRNGWVWGEVTVVTNDGWAYGHMGFWDGDAYEVRERPVRWRIYLPEP